MNNNLYKLGDLTKFTNAPFMGGKFDDQLVDLDVLLNDVDEVNTNRITALCKIVADNSSSNTTLIDIESILDYSKSISILLLKLTDLCKQMIVSSPHPLGYKKNPTSECGFSAAMSERHSSECTIGCEPPSELENDGELSEDDILKKLSGDLKKYAKLNIKVPYCHESPLHDSCAYNARKNTEPRRYMGLPIPQFDNEDNSDIQFMGSYTKHFDDDDGYEVVLAIPKSRFTKRNVVVPTNDINTAIDTFSVYKKYYDNDAAPVVDYALSCASVVLKSCTRKHYIPSDEQVVAIKSLVSGAADIPSVLSDVLRNALLIMIAQDVDIKSDTTVEILEFILSALYDLFDVDTDALPLMYKGVEKYISTMVEAISEVNTFYVISQMKDKYGIVLDKQSYDYLAITFDRSQTASYRNSTLAEFYDEQPVVASSVFAAIFYEKYNAIKNL